MYIYYLIALLTASFLTVLTERKLIPLLKSVKMEQKILEIGPRWHKSKEGTPTMGGLGFIFAFIITFCLVFIIACIRGEDFDAWRAGIAFVFSLLCGCIGFIDDYAKFFKKQNEGLKAGSKYLLQLAISAVYLFFTVWKGGIGTVLRIPYLNIEWDMGFFYYVFALILITGIINSVNLTDGIDGLAGSVTAVVCAFFSVVAFVLGQFETGIFSALLLGSCLGFLFYNFYPARVFMGDTGSLFLGGAVVSMAFMINSPLIIVICGIIYIIESLSVILQVASFKLTGKRIFKMSPIHHHFEKSGWSEIKIVGVFSLVTFVFCVLAYFGV